ncbi:MAG: signal peptidase I [Cyanobacteriota bacterium]
MSPRPSDQQVSPSPRHSSPHDQAPQEREDPWAFWRSILLNLAVALGIRQFVVEARYIPSGSMLPGLQLQDRLLVEKLSYRGRPPRRGEIVVFHAPHHFDPVLAAQHRPGPLGCLLVNIPLLGPLLGLQEPACDADIKRVIGIPSDRVVVDPRGLVTINGRRLREPYVKNTCPVDSKGMGPCPSLDVRVPPNQVLVLGDNRGNSWDARFWPGGPFLPHREIIGRAFWRFFPLNSAGSLQEASEPAATAPKR